MHEYLMKEANALSQPLCVTEFTFSPDVGIHFITAVVCFGMGNGSL